MIHRIWTSSVLFGLLATILGIVMLAWPGPSILVAAGLFGAYLVVSGIAMAVLAFSSPLASGGTRFFSFVTGVMSIILGVLAFRHFGEGYAVLLLAIWIGVGFIFRGVGAVASVTSFPRFPGRGWAIFFAVISILAGIVVLAYPFDSIVTLALVVGIWLVVLGVMEVVSAFAIRSDAKKVEKAAAGVHAHAAPATR
ncbi:MAG TPA: HdeD family acid-resistance protein [Mycobacterium sp.]|nr:HdeD family acid-resistance protein [Mycobacterium sp.]